MKGLVAGLCACLVLATACAPRAANTSPSGSHLRELLRHDEIEQSTQRDMDLYAAIQSLRPQMLTPAPGVKRASNDADLAVYVDHVRQAGIVALRSIVASRVEEVRYLNPTASQNELGPIASAGAIMVTVRKANKEPPTT